MNDKTKVFLSYAKEDQTYTRRLFEELKNRNIEVWFDKESLLPGQKWKIEIRKAIQASRYFIAILSSKSVTKRGVVQKEIKEALDVLDEFPENKIFIIPIRIDSCEPSNEKLREIQWVDMFPNWEEGLEKIFIAMDFGKKQHQSHIFTDVEEEISALLIEARSCIDRESSISVLHRAEHLCKRIMKEDNPMGYELMVEILSELANESDLPSKRYKLWKDCLLEASRGIDKFNDALFAEALASKTVDFIQDLYITIPITEANHLLASVGEKIDYFLKKLPIHEGSHLLSRKSSLIRNMTKFHTTRITQEKMSQKALRCAQKAVNLNPDSWDAYLELALSIWHIAQFDKGDQQYHDRLKLSEDHFWKSISIKPTVYNLLAICRFFRYTYQTGPFLECFNKYLAREYNKRRLLQGAYVYGEVAMQLWYSMYPLKVIEHHIKDAERLLEESIDGGFGDARHIIDLAFIKAARGEINVGEDILKTLHSLSRDRSWTKIAEIVSKIGSADDLVAQGFALGIADSSIWNKLGTFIKDFLGDLSLAIVMYKVALRLNPSNAVAMTSLAQALLNEDNPESTQEAERWISKAASCADRRFRWWRNVREQVREKRISFIGQKPHIQKMGNHLRSSSRLSNLLHNYNLLKSMQDHQRRGFEFEKLVAQLFRISLENSFASYRTSLKWINSPVMQIDAAFSFFDKDFYRVETKWTSDPVTPTDIVLFREKLDAVGVKGLFISISGFTTEAIQKAYDLRRERQILLMDGEELELILQGSPPLDEVIRLKQIYFGKESNPYFRIKPTVQVEVYA